MKDNKGWRIGLNVLQGVCSRGGNAGIECVRGGLLAYVLNQSLVAISRVLGCGIKIGSDLGNVGRAEIIDDALYVAALIQIGAGFKCSIVIGYADHGGEVAAGGFTPHDDDIGLDSIFVSVCAQISDRRLDVLNA